MCGSGSTLENKKQLVYESHLVFHITHTGKERREEGSFMNILDADTLVCLSISNVIL